jgi:hypothetical protein
MKERNRKYETKHPRWCKRDCWECKWAEEVVKFAYDDIDIFCSREDERQKWYKEKFLLLEEEL